VLDGGLQAWKAAGHYVAGGDGLQVAEGDVTVDEAPRAPAQRWPETAAFIEMHPGTQLLDTRNAIEFDGSEKHPKAARAGHIPGAAHLDWVEVLRDRDGDHRLKSLAQLESLLAEREIEKGEPVVTYCQSGTRSAAVYFALYQAGYDMSQTLNYDGSWAEYSRLDLPVEP
jgi:thiosulfate/3-mercaptopyruvate sulfurtransferase